RMGVEGVLVGRGVLRNPWILAQAADLAAGRAVRAIGASERREFLLAYIDLLLNERVREPEGFRHQLQQAASQQLSGHDKWVVNKIRALVSWYSKGVEN